MLFAGLLTPFALGWDEYPDIAYTRCQTVFEDEYDTFLPPWARALADNPHRVDQFDLCEYMRGDKCPDKTVCLLVVGALLNNTQLTNLIGKADQCAAQQEACGAYDKLVRLLKRSEIKASAISHSPAAAAEREASVVDSVDSDEASGRASLCSVDDVDVDVPASEPD